MYPAIKVDHCVKGVISKKKWSRGISILLVLAGFDKEKGPDCGEVVLQSPEQSCTAASPAALTELGFEFVFVELFQPMSSSLY